jgi:hypothetical protein
VAREDEQHHAHLIFPKKLWDQLGKLANKMTKAGKRTSRTQLLIRGGQIVLQIDKDKEET